MDNNYYTEKIAPKGKNTQRFAYNAFQRCHKAAFGDASVGKHDIPAFHSPRRFHNSSVTLLEFYAFRGKIIYLSHVFKPYSNNFHHCCGGFGRIGFDFVGFAAVLSIVPLFVLFNIKE